ncbi:ABC transporter substrate-binding protein [Desulfobacterales bacterium HSG17]|nr:ABC transporter substrate-binding protein [Desulfobacterales bacterium HSG17]
MKKLIILFIVLGINAAGIILLLPESPFNVKKDTIYIAIAVPMSSSMSTADRENGKAMLRGVNMYLDSIKNSSILKNKKIELLVYNDKDKQTAISIASQIADEGKVLLVLGHYDSEGSIAAGTIYRKNGIPAITASATSETVTKDNDWYFRIVPDNSFIKNFIVHGLKNLLNSTSASIIYDNNNYGRSIALGFEAEAKKTGININNKWFFDSDDEKFDNDINDIIGNLRASRNPGTIFCATYETEGSRFFASCRYPGTNYTVVGPDTFSTQGFISQFNDYPREQMSPGYYSDGIYAISPFISYLADGEDALAFRRKFVSKYGKEPSWVAACHYDAMKVAFSALEKAEIQGQDIRENRRRIRKALAGINEQEIAVKGITGDIYFDKDGNVTRYLAIGTWNKHIFLPIYRQYQGIQPTPVSNKNIKSDVKKGKKELTDKKETKEEIIEIQGQAMTFLNVVYVGIDIDKITNIDTKKGTFTADFYLWFRFSGHFDDTRIKFINAVNPVVLEAPVMAETINKISTRSYRLTADFKADYDTNAYPLDKHKLRISLRHKDLTRNNLIFVHDVTRLPQISKNRISKNGTGEKETGGNDANRVTMPIPGWDTKNISFSQNIIKVPVSEKQSISYSQFNTNIQVQRQGRIFLLAKILFPLIMIVIVLYFVFMLPSDLPVANMLICIPAVMITLGIHLLYGYILPGQESIRYIFPAIYVLAGLPALISCLIHIMHKRNSAEKIRFLPGFGKILYILLALTGSGFLLYSYWPLLVS